MRKRQIAIKLSEGDIEALLGNDSSEAAYGRARSKIAHGREQIRNRAAENPCQRDVAEFHRLNHLSIGDVDQIELRNNQLRSELIAEEANETVLALNANDLIGTIDGLCDLIYVAYGTAIEAGIDLEPFWEEVHRSNLSKLGGELRADGKQLKPAGYSAPDLEAVLAELLEGTDR